MFFIYIVLAPVPPIRGLNIKDDISVEIEEGPNVYLLFSR
jgi:hypothetical protein